MREMKDSGIEWIGKVPDEWKVDKLKYHLKRNEPRNQGDKQVLSLYRDFGVIPKDSRDDNFNVTSEDTSKYKYVKPGNFVINKMKAWQGSVAVSDYEGIVSPAYYVYEFTDDNIYKRYFHYLMRSCYKDEFMRMSGGIRVGQWDLPAEALDNTLILIPLYDEQVQIADFLDFKCSEIDALTADIETQIDTLEQYKRSMITEAVTKGLDQDAEMKDSGVEWIGAIPKEWDVIKLKYCAWLKGRIGWQGLRADEFTDDEFLPYLITGTDFENGYINWSTCAHISEDRFNQDFVIHVKEDDLLITKDGTIGKIAVAKNCPSEVSVNSGIFIIRNSGQYPYSDRFIYYLIQSYEFELWFELSDVGRSTIKHLTQEKFYSFKFALPSVSEQHAIADYLDTKCSEIDSIISDKRTQLDTLADYKKSLIYEYVTGKKEVPAS